MERRRALDGLNPPSSILERLLTRAVGLTYSVPSNTIGLGKILGTTLRQTRNGTARTGTGRTRLSKATDPHHGNNDSPSTRERQPPTTTSTTSTTITTTIYNKNPALTHKISRRLPFLQSTKNPMRRRETRMSELHVEIKIENVRISLAYQLLPPPLLLPRATPPCRDSCPKRLDIRRNRLVQPARLTSLPPFPQPRIPITPPGQPINMDP
jgi:hypothetical protein